MHNSEFHEKEFDEGTLCKLEMYRQYLRTWLPTFINNIYVDTIQIFDFFAGPGYDGKGNQGSPIIASEEIRAALDCNKIREGLKIKLFFNELDKNKYNILKSNVACIAEINPEIEITIENKKFADIFAETSHLMSNQKVANFIFLDQFGVSEITKNVFESMVTLKRTDFIFFISASIINRVKRHPDIVKYIPEISHEDWGNMTGKNVNRILCDAYQKWIPLDTNYYLSNFSIKKGANVYGLIFGSGHPLGMDKFLKVAWEMGGDANFDIDGDNIDKNQPALFAEFDKPSKITTFEEELEKKILNKEIISNKQVYIFALQCGVLASHARDTLQNMYKTNKLPHQNIHISHGAWKKDHTESIIYFDEEGN